MNAVSSFNTVNGKYCYIIAFVLPSLRSGTCNVWASSSHSSSAASHPSAHTVNGKDCCNRQKTNLKCYKLLKQRFNTVNDKHCCNFKIVRKFVIMVISFNTVSGKYYCQITFVLPSLCSGTWDVRTSSSRCSSAISHPSAHTVNGKYYCNYNDPKRGNYRVTAFQYRKR